jgi:hypothetical protein
MGCQRGHGLQYRGVKAKGFLLLVRSELGKLLEIMGNS